MILPESTDISDFSVTITRQDFEKLKEHTSICYPAEACALLFGTVSDKKCKIKEVLIVPNLSGVLNQFQIHKESKKDAIKKANYPFIGIYHSHIKDTGPSQGDIKEMRKEKNIWVIGYTKKAKGKIRFFKLNAYYLNKTQMFNLKMEEEL